MQQQQDEPLSGEQQQDEPQPDEQQQQQQQHPQATAVADTPQRVQRPDECGVCLFFYDELDRRPRNLPCGHTYCSLCVCVLLQDGHLICPSCRTDHCAPEVNHFPISYTVEAMMKMMPQQVEAASQASGKALQATGEAPQTTLKVSEATGAKTKKRAAAGLSRKLRAMVQEQKMSLESLETTLQKEVEQLNQYRAKLAVSRTKHAHLLKELDEVVQQHQTSMDQLQEEDVRVEGFVVEGEEAQQELRVALGQLDQVNTAQEAFTTIDAADHTIVEAEEWLQHSREEMPNGIVLRTSFRVQEATKAALKVISDAEATPDQATSGHSNCTLMEAVEIVEEVVVELVDLHTERLREKVAAGLMFATQKYKDGTCYSSKVICEKDKMYLHALKNESPPGWAFTLQVSKALENIKYPDISLFLDLAWPGTSPQRVHIKLVADTPLTRQFVTLCLGHTGLTYCNTNLISGDYYYYKRIIWGGDISGQEAAGNQVLPPIQANECGGTVGINTGMVVARTDLSDAAKRTQFGFVLYYGNGYTTDPLLYHLGSVDADGQSVVQRAADNNSGGITQVRVVDCGVVY